MLSSLHVFVYVAITEMCAYDPECIKYIDL